MEYAILINGGYFKDYVYSDKKVYGRFGKVIFYEGDIVDIITTKDIERTEVKRSIGNTIGTLYTIDKLKYDTIKIIPCC